MIGPIPSASAPAVDPAAAGKEAQLRKAAEAFEAVFLRQVIGSMRQAKLGEDLFGSAATDQFRELADGKLADSMAGQGSFGIAELLLQQFGAGKKVTPPPALAAAPARQADQGAAK